MSKTRDISKVNFFETLQREYVCANFRRQIYYKPNDKDYWRKICDFKKEKIESLAYELGIPSIFDNEDILILYIKNFKNEGGRPIFIYKEDGSDEALKETDLLNYYKKDSDVKEFFFSQVNGVGEIGKIIDDSDVLAGNIMVQYPGRKVICKLEHIVRLL